MIRGSLSKLERHVANFPPPPPPPPPWLAGFVASYHALPVEERQWVYWAMHGFTNPEPHVSYPENEAHLYAAGDFPPWGYSERPPIPDWLPGLLARLGLPPVAEVERTAAGIDCGEAEHERDASAVRERIRG
jgi:hypothetical protein